MPSKVFISGAAGFLGSHLADRMLSRGHEVVGCDSLVGGYLDNVPKGIEFHQYDIEDFKTNLKHLQGVDTVYHAAALAFDGFSVYGPHLVSKSIYSNSISLMSAAVEAGVKRFVFCSSMARYGQGHSHFKEDMTPKPITPYGISKLAAEEVLKNLCETHGMEYCICVPHNIIGVRQKYDDPFRNVAAIMTNRMLQGQQPYIYGDGSQVRCFSVVYDCLQVLDQLGESPLAKNEIFNIGPDEEEITILQLAKTLADIIDFDLDPIFLPARPRDAKNAVCCSDKIREVFNYKTSYPLRRGLEELVAWIDEMGPKPFDFKNIVEIKGNKLPILWKEAIL